jgi:hypothetical protein
MLGITDPKMSKWVQERLTSHHALRANDKCSNSNVGQQVQGNDNSITGFGDQSKNIQANLIDKKTLLFYDNDCKKFYQLGRIILHSFFISLLLMSWSAL